MNNQNGFKKFLCSGVGKAVIITILYCLIFGFMVLIAESNFKGIEYVAIVFVLLFAIFGWKALNKIQPEIFLFMPIGGWLIYFIVKGVLSIIIGMFVAPFVISKKIAEIIQKGVSSIPDVKNSGLSDAEYETEIKKIIVESTDEELRETYTILSHLLMSDRGYEKTNELQEVLGHTDWTEAEYVFDLTAKELNDRKRRTNSNV